MNRWVEVTFDCMPLRTVPMGEPPVDASPKFQAFVMRVQAAVRKHGTFNSYYVHRGVCSYHVTNHPVLGAINLEFEGTLLTDDSDTRTLGSDLTVKLASETCEWLTPQVVSWFEKSAARAVEVEFDRYIQAGDLEKTRQRLAEMQKAAEESGGFMGMFL